MDLLSFNGGLLLESETGKYFAAPLYHLSARKIRITICIVSFENPYFLKVSNWCVLITNRPHPFNIGIKYCIKHYLPAPQVTEQEVVELTHFPFGL